MAHATIYWWPYAGPSRTVSNKGRGNFRFFFVFFFRREHFQSLVIMNVISKRKSFPNSNDPDHRSNQLQNVEQSNQFRLPISIGSQKSYSWAIFGRSRIDLRVEARNSANIVSLRKVPSQYLKSPN